MLDQQRADFRLEELELLLLLVIGIAEARNQPGKDKTQGYCKSSWKGGHRQVSTGVRSTDFIIAEARGDPQPLWRIFILDSDDLNLALFACGEGNWHVQLAIVADDADHDSISRLLALDLVLKVVTR